MAKTLSVLFAVLALTVAVVGTAFAQDARAVVQAAAKNMGADSLRTIQNQNMLIAYLPKEKIVVEGDLYTPPAAGAPLPTANASNRTFRETVQRLRLDISQIASIHGRVAQWDEFVKVIGTGTN